MNQPVLRHSLAPSILRDIGNQVEPYVLARPLTAAASATTEVLSPRSAQDHAAPASDAAGQQAPLGQSSAEQQLQALQNDLQQAYATARQQGFDKGLEGGRQQGLSEGTAAAEQRWQEALRAQQNSMQERLAPLDQLLAALPTAIAARIEAAQDDMVALCHQVLCRLLGDQETQQATALALVRQAIRTCCGEAEQHAALHGLLAVQLHPQDVELLKSDPAMRAWLQQQGARTVQWQADAQVRLGGCVVRSTQGTLDARLETQLTALQEILLSGRRQAALAEGPHS